MFDYLQMPRGLSPGALAPDFALRDAVAGGEYTLDALLARGPLVLLLLPGTGSPETRAALDAACASHERIRKAGVTLSAIVCQAAYPAVAHFAETAPEKGKPPFPVLVDATRAVAKAYGLSSWWFRSVRPATFVIGPDRRILFRHAAGADPGNHVPAETLLAVARAFPSPGPTT